MNRKESPQNLMFSFINIPDIYLTVLFYNIKVSLGTREEHVYIYIYKHDVLTFCYINFLLHDYTFCRY